MCVFSVVCMYALCACACCVYTLYVRVFVGGYLGVAPTSSEQPRQYMSILFSYKSQIKRGEYFGKNFFNFCSNRLCWPKLSPNQFSSSEDGSPTGS